MDDKLGKAQCQVSILSWEIQTIIEARSAIRLSPFWTEKSDKWHPHDSSELNGKRLKADYSTSTGGGRRTTWPAALK